MISFETYGAVAVPTEKLKAARVIAHDLRAFWSEHEHIAEKTGCYIFSIKTGRASVPFYVGKTARSFESECFTPHKLMHYSTTLAHYQKGKPQMTFVSAEMPRGKPSKSMVSAITELETFLIQTAVRANPLLRNVRGTRDPGWVIQGVLRETRGRRTHAQTHLAKMLHLQTR